MMRMFSTRLQSLEYLLKASQIFSYSDTEALKTKIAEIEELIQKGSFREYRYNSAFERAPILCDYIKAKDLGTLK